MKRKTDLTQALVVDYSAARERAIRWLGDRYLLAKPINVNRYSAAGASTTERANSTPRQ